MSMQTHILSALREQFERWEELLAGMEQDQLCAPHLPSEWSTKDELVHLWGWQQRSIARLQAGLQGGEPQYPQWIDLDPEAEDVDGVNAWLYETNRQATWDDVHTRWRAGFLSLLELGAAIPEPALLDSSRYAWLDGSPLVITLLATYDHHQEHLDTWLAWLGR